ncbi:MAG: YHS domain-containing protein [Desulfobacteraceae bacterium]|nr:MAG: YHS domain-containing protein [Desulfobacteraceae bacterium]
MKLIIYLILIYLVYKVIKTWMTPSAYSGKKEYGSTGQLDDVMIKDPVCGVYFPKKDGIYLNSDGRDLYFCSTECRDRFVDSISKK